MSLQTDVIEHEIRDMLRGCLVKQSKDNNIPLNALQLRFSSYFENEEIQCKYELLNDYSLFKELTFIEIAGLFKAMFKNVVEAYICQLYEIINEKEDIELANIRIIIQCTASNPTTDDLIAHLFNRNKLVRELKVSEFVKGSEPEAEEVQVIEETKNETND